MPVTSWSVTRHRVVNAAGNAPSALTDWLAGVMLTPR